MKFLSVVFFVLIAGCKQKSPDNVSRYQNMYRAGMQHCIGGKLEYSKELENKLEAFSTRDGQIVVIINDSKADYNRLNNVSLSTAVLSTIRDPYMIGTCGEYGFQETSVDPRIGKVSGDFVQIYP